MSEAPNAVFLSYASQDAVAVRRIAEVLRAAGVEVWFDQNELVGGDAWDQKIRRQIKECALFVPVISAATQARTEGYFRLEWRLADQRTHLMAKGRPFVLPVVIDDTRDAEAHVPDSFTEVQWTRLPGWAETAARLAPGGAGDDALASYYVSFERDPARALPYAQNAVRALPNDSAAHARLGGVYASLTQIADCEASFRRAIALDPFNAGYRAAQLLLLSWLRRPAEFETADAEYRRVCGERAETESSRDNRFRLYGELVPSAEQLRLPMERIKWLMRGRHWTEALAQLEAALANNKNMLIDERHRRLIQRCDVLRRLQREPEARQSAQEAKAWLEETSAQPERDVTERDFRLAVTLSRLGESDAALAAFQRFVNARSGDVTPAERISRERQLAEFYATLNRPRECVELLAKLLRVPSGLTVPMLKVDLAWDNVRENAAFQALLADPKNSAPL